MNLHRPTDTRDPARGPAHTHDHDPAHDHGHSEAHGHAHDHDDHHHGHAHGHLAMQELAGASGSLRRSLAIGMALNLAFVFVEVGFGLWSHSLALVADAGHNFADVVGLVLAWGAATLALRRPTDGFTYGLRASTILAALSNAMILVVVTGAIIWASIQRLADLRSIDSTVVMLIAALGLVINAGSAALFFSGRHKDLNARGAFLHLAGDAAVSLGVIVAGAVIGVTGWLWLDPVVGIVIGCAILAGTWELLRQSLRLAMHAVPSGVDCSAVRDYLSHQAGVREVHDLHIWAMSTTENALTVHLVMPGGHPGDAFLDQVSEELDRRFHLGHATLQVETGEGSVCRLAAAHVV